MRDTRLTMGAAPPGARHPRGWLDQGDQAVMGCGGEETASEMIPAVGAQRFDNARPRGPPLPSIGTPIDTYGRSNVKGVTRITNSDRNHA